MNIPGCPIISGNKIFEMNFSQVAALGTVQVMAGGFPGRPTVIDFVAVLPPNTPRESTVMESPTFTTSPGILNSL